MPRRPADDDDDGLDRLRQVAVAVFIALSALLAVATVVGRPVSDAFTGLTYGALLTLLGLEGLVRVVRSGRDEP